MERGGKVPGWKGASSRVQNRGAGSVYFRSESRGGLTWKALKGERSAAALWYPGKRRETKKTNKDE